MKVCGATKGKDPRNYRGNFHLYGNRYEAVYFMMRQKLLQKLLHRLEGCVWSYLSIDDRGMRWYQSCDGKCV